ncbi:MAG: biopolymer transporter ExbD [Verrucomicrobiota bacterium]
MRRIKRRNQEPQSFQMAPMIDMVFLLLVFFMTVASVAKSQRLVDLELPESEESKVPEDASDRGILSVDAEGNFYIGDQPHTLEQIKAAITARIAAAPTTRVQIRADQNTEYESVRKLLKTAAEAGAYEIIYATYEAR